MPRNPLFLMAHRKAPNVITNPLPLLDLNLTIDQYVSIQIYL